MMRKKTKKQWAREHRYENQVKTYIKKNGRKKYREAGSKGGGPNSPGSFTSESARQASLKGWAMRRDREKLEQEANDGS